MKRKNLGRKIALLFALMFMLSSIPMYSNAEDECLGATVDVSAMFKMPYVSTYYFNPKPTIYDNIQIPIYITDYEQSEYLNNDTSITLDIIYEVDGESKTISNAPLGDYTLTIGQLREGKHIIAIQTLDKRTGLKSHKLYNDLWVVDPATSEISASQTYYMTDDDLELYKINNSNSADATDVVDTRDGLTKLFADKQAEGYRKIVLLEGIYRIDGEDASGHRMNSIFIPSYFTVDMNGSTFKLNTILSDINASEKDPGTSGSIIKMEDVVDAHLINGTLEGDRMERAANELEKGGKGEAINTVTINGGKYCTLEDLTIKNTTGHTVFTQGLWGPISVIYEYSNYAIINGEVMNDPNCRTSSMIDLTDIISWRDDEDYMYVGHPEGIRGLKGDSAFVYVNFYDSNGNFMETVEGMQYRKILIPSGAKYTRVTIWGTGVSTVRNDANTFSVYVKHYGDYHEFKNLDFYDTRTTAMSPSTCNNLLIEGCTYTRVGSRITPAIADFEDGWEECQDVYYRNNIEIERAEGNTGSIIDNTGFNHIYENCVNHDITIRYRVIGAVVRNINDLNTVVEYQIGTEKRGKFGRIYNNNCGDISVAYKDKENNYIEPVNFKIKDCTITSIPGNTNTYTHGVPGKTVFENCTFTCFGGGNSSFVGCTIQLSENDIYDNLYCKDCTILGPETSKVKLSGLLYKNRVFENCRFTGKTPLTNYNLYAGTFKSCEFEDLSMIASTHDGEETILFEDCIINSSAVTFIDIGPYGYSEPNHINLIFRNCNITHTGNVFLKLTSPTTDGSQVFFDNCSVNKEIDTGLNPDLIKVVNNEQSEISIKGYSVSLGGDIALNFHILIPDSIRSNSSAVVHVELPDGSSEDMSVSNGVADTGNAHTYIYSCHVPAAYMTGRISAQVQLLSGGSPEKVSEVFMCSVQEYAEYVINNSTKYNAAKVEVAKAMLNYGAYAQLYFGVDTEKLTNRNVYNSSNDPVLNFNQNLSSRQISAVTTKGDLEYYGASLVCLGETSIKLYFGSRSGAVIANGRYTVKATCNGKTRACTGEVVNNVFVVTLTGIVASGIDDTYQFTVTDTKNSSNNFTFGYSPLDYIAGAQKGSNDALIYLTRALYLYNQAADKAN